MQIQIKEIVKIINVSKDSPITDHKKIRVFRFCQVAPTSIPQLK